MKNLPLNIGLIVLFLIGFMGIFGHSLLAMDLTKNLEVKKYHPKLESVLGALVEKYSQSKMLAQDFAEQHKISLKDNQVTVVLVPLPGEKASAIDQVSLVSYGATIEAVSRHLIRARVPLSILEEIADNMAGVSYIRLPYKPFSDMAGEESKLNSSDFTVAKQNLSTSVISQGVDLTEASEYHNLGYKGRDTKVAVIDIGFNGLTRSQKHGELPEDVVTKDFTGTGLETGRNHGTAVAEIVHDMAPEAKLYLCKVADEVDLENAKDYCIEQDVDIINHSWCWPNTNFTDGTGRICDIANDARSNGVLWVNAAGNLAHLHYQGVFTDTDGNGRHEFSVAPIDEDNTFHHGGGELDVYLTWNYWPTTDEDYDLYLYDSSFNLVGSSTTRQTGSQPPTEQIIRHDLVAGEYYTRVQKYGARRNDEIAILWWSYTASHLEHETPEHSVCSPADAIGAMAVGYINIGNWETGPQGTDSSQGSTNDGRMKPDIMGPSHISSYTWGIGNYTSAATPHVTGAAALILSKYPDCTASQLQATLESWAVDMGILGKDNIYGSGRLRLLLEPPVSPTLQDLKVYPNPFRPFEGHKGVIFNGLTDAKIRIFTPVGELVREAQVIGQGSWLWDGKNEEGEEVARGIYIYLITDNAGNKKIGKIAVIR